MGCETARTRRDIDALFVEGLSSRRWRALREHLYACRECRGYYDRVMLLDRKLAGDGAALSPAQLGLIGGMVVDGAATRPPLAWLSRWIGEVGASARRGAWAVGVAASVALVALVVLPLALRRLGNGDEFQARGAAAGDGAGVRAVCVASEPGHAPFVRAVLPDPANRAQAACRRSDTLHFTYANVAPGKGAPFEYLFVFGVDGALEPHWYYPQPGEGESVRLDASALGDGRLPGGIALSVRHGVGPVRIFALFTHQPVSLAEMAGRVERWRVEKRPFDSLARVGLGNGAESTFVVPIGE